MMLTGLTWCSDAAQLRENLEGSETETFGSMKTPSVPARKRRGKCMSRRKGQNPQVRTKRRVDGTQVYYFQYWLDVPGVEERKRMTDVIGPVSQMTKSEAERKKLDFLQKLEVNSSTYVIPSAHKFRDAVKHYRTEFAPENLRPSTVSVAEINLQCHLEPRWSETPIEHITIESVNEWAKTKRKEGLSWVTIKNVLRTMQRVLSAFSKDGKPPFSMRGLKISSDDKLEMALRQGSLPSRTWEEAMMVTQHIRTMGKLGAHRKEQYAALVLLASAPGLRYSEMAALRVGDVDFVSGVITVDEAADMRTSGQVGRCKNLRAYRQVPLLGEEGRVVLERRVIGDAKDPCKLIFCSKRGNPLQETYVLHDGLYPALQALGLPKSGFHAFRRGCNRRWELRGLSPVILRQMMGHSVAAMTERYTGRVPLQFVQSAVTKALASELETMETESTA
jgi:integrase